VGHVDGTGGYIGPGAALSLATGWVFWLLCSAAPKASRGRLIRIIDGTSVPKAGKTAKRESALWRIHSAFDLNAYARDRGPPFPFALNPLESWNIWPLGRGTSRNPL
jgi:hypothetical protein